MDLIELVPQDEGYRQCGLAEEWSTEVRCRRSHGALVSRVMAYAVVFVVQQREVRVAGVRRGHRVMSRMMSYVALHASVEKVVAMKKIVILNWSSGRCTMKGEAVSCTARTSHAVVGKVVGKEKKRWARWWLKQRMNCSTRAA